MEAIRGIYHPDKVDTETFIANFTIRLKEFANIIDTLSKQNKKPLQHFLITGKRGMGKSTLLRRIFLEAEEKPISNKLIAVRLGSEQYKLSRLYKLWEEVIKHLALKEPVLNTKREKLSEEKNYEQNIIQIIVDYLNTQDKTLLLLIDNFDQLIDKLNTKEQHTLREILIQYPIQIIGNTVFYDEHFYSYNKPFYDFFKPIHLKNLNKIESEDFIKQLALKEGIENFEEIFIRQKGKIQTLRILSGGVPRTLVILLSILSKRNTGEAIDYLHEMLEQVTPLYQDRMKALSSQQQEIMHHLAIHWDRTPVKDLATEMRLPSKSISAQLTQLENSGYINKISTNNRNLLYEIDERFFNIWLLMSEASAYDAKRVVWLTRWLDMFYDSKELEDYASYFNNSLQKNKPANRFLLVQALSECENLGRNIKDKIVSEMARELSEIMPEVKDWAKVYDNQKVNSIKKIATEINVLVKDNKYEKAFEKFDALKKLDEAEALYGISLLYLTKQDYDNAEKHLLLILNYNNSDVAYLLASLYFEIKKDYVKAEKYFRISAERGNTQAMFNLGLLYKNIKKEYKNAEKYYLMGMEQGDVEATFNLAILYNDIYKDFKNAERYYLIAVEGGFTKAMVNLGLMYDEQMGNFEKAEKYYLMAMEKKSDAGTNNLASLYFSRNSNENKAKSLQLISKIDISNSNPFFLVTKIQISLWGERIKEAKFFLDALIDVFKYNDAVQIISQSLLYFLVFKQTQHLLMLFTSKEHSLINQFKPIYFALMHEMQRDLPNEFLKMPEELREPVNDLLAFVRSERERLGIN